MNVLTVLRKLTDVYAKNPNSNVGKTLTLLTEQMDFIESEAKKVELWRNIDKAEGSTLDQLGLARGQARGHADDEIYRILIKTRIAQSSSDGTIPFLINFISHLLDVPTSEVKITNLMEQAERNKIPTLKDDAWNKSPNLIVKNDYEAFVDDSPTWKSIKDMKWSDMSGPNT